MTRDPLAALARLRRFESDSARRELAAQLRQVAVAGAHYRATEAAQAGEMRATEAVPDALRTACFVQWWPRARAALDSAAAAERSAEQVASASRAGLLAAHAADAAVGRLMEARDQARRHAAARAEQLELDDLTRARR